MPLSQRKIDHQINVASIGGYPNDYRIPDVVLLTRERFHSDRNEYLDSGSEVTGEIRNANEETYSKWVFYREISDDGIWVIDRRTQKAEVYRSAASGYQ